MVPIPTRPALFIIILMIFRLVRNCSPLGVEGALYTSPPCVAEAGFPNRRPLSLALGVRMLRYPFVLFSKILTLFAIAVAPDEPLLAVTIPLKRPLPLTWNFCTGL